MAKKIILCVIDSLHPAVLEQCWQRKAAPALDFLRQNGYYYRDCISVFPTITPVASASIATGAMPEDHRIPGFAWFDGEKGRYVNYGVTNEAILKYGPRRVLYNWEAMNRRHLSPRVSTVFEALEARGISCGCVNFFIRRSGMEHPLCFPLQVRLLTGFHVPGPTLQGPELCVMGVTCYPPWLPVHNLPGKIRSQRFGVNDAVSGWAAVQIIRQGRLPDFLLLYFPTNDHFSHRHGPRASGPSIEMVDQHLGEMLDAFGSWEKAVREAVFMVVGDHAQTAVQPGQILDLDQALEGFHRLKLRDRSSRNRNVAVSVNDRMAYIDLLPGREGLLPEVVDRCAGEPGIDLVLWAGGGVCHAVRGRQRLEFWSGGEYTDRNGRPWGYRGDLGVVDGKAEDKTIRFGDYPDAFERIKGALGSVTSRVILSATPGWELKGEGTKVHPGGGSHGSLHREDSLVPLIISGRDIDHPHLAGIKQFICEHFGV